MGLLLSSAFVGQAWAEPAVSASNISVVLPSDNGTFTATENKYFAVVFNAHAQTADASITLNTDQEISLTATGNNKNAYGIQSSVDSSSVGRDSLVSLTTSKDVKITSTSESNYAEGIITSSGGDVLINAGGSVHITSTATASGKLGTGITAAASHGNSDVTINSSNNTIDASYAGIDVYTHNAVVNLNAISNEDGLGNNIINGTTAGVLAWAMYVPESGDGKAYLNASKDNIITTKGYGIYSEGGSANVEFEAGNNNTITSDRYDVYANDNGTVKLTATENNNLDSKDVGVYTDNGSSATLEAKINTITAPTVVNSLNGGYTTITATDTNNLTGNLSASDNGQITTTSTNATSLTGDALNEGGTITLNMGTGSQWDGKSTMQDSTDAASGVTYSAVTKATLGAGSVWNLTDDSQLTTLDATNSVINMVGNAKKLTMNNLLGGGNTFKMDLKYLGDGKTVSDYQASAETDFVTVTDRSSGTNTLLFAPSGDNVGAMSKADQKLYFAQIAGSAGFTMDTATAVDASKLYDREYKVKSEENAAGAGTDWYIGLDETQPDDPVKPDPQPNENVTSEKGKMMAAYALGTDMDRLNKRLGEARYLEDEKGVWVRYRHNRIGWDKSYKTNGNMFQVGYDKERIEKDGKHYRGGAIDYTRASTTLQDVVGKGDHDRYGISLYDTWIGDKGHYHDLVLRGGRINNEFDVRNRVNETIHSDYHRNFASISGEYGRKIDGKDGWYIEPQTQLQIARIGSGSYTTDKGVHAEQDGATSVIGRLGFRLGRETFNAEGNKANNYYFKADLMHEFAGDQGYTVSDGEHRLSEKFDGQDTWFDIGFGADIKLSNKNTFFVDVERTLGSDFKSTWQVNGGFRWEF